MLTMIGILLAAPGALAALAGVCAMRRVRRLRRDGVTAWALTAAPPPSRDWQSAGTPRQMLVRYALPDGQVYERITLAKVRKSSLEPGQKVLVWYDPEDPADVLVYGRWSRAIDRAFVAGGTLCVLIGGWIALLRP